MKTPTILAAVAALALSASVGFSAQAQGEAQSASTPAVGVPATAAGSTAAAKPDPQAATPGDAKLTEDETAHAEDVIKTKCTTCHGVEPIVAEHLDKAGWSQTLDNMGPNAQLTKDETALVLRYLVENLGPQAK